MTDVLIKKEILGTDMHKGGIPCEDKGRVHGDADAK